MNWNRDILYNKKTAVLIMALMILFSCLFGTWKPLHKMRAEVSAMFWGSGGRDEISIQEDLKTKTGYASNLIVLAKKYNIDSRFLEESIVKVNEGKTASEKMSANRELSDAVEEISRKILESADSLNMNDTDRRAFDSTYTRIMSQEDIITRSMNKYDDAALKYNQELSGFPANIFGRIVNLKRL